MNYIYIVCILFHISLSLTITCNTFKKYIVFEEDDLDFKCTTNSNGDITKL